MHFNPVQLHGSSQSLWIRDVCRADNGRYYATEPRLTQDQTKAYLCNGSQRGKLHDAAMSSIWYYILVLNPYYAELYYNTPKEVKLNTFNSISKYDIFVE